MSSKSTWIIIGLVIAIFIAFGIIYWRLNYSGLNSSDNEQVLNDLNKALEQTGSPVISNLSSDPLLKALPEDDPISKSNPFKEEYINPFE